MSKVNRSIRLSQVVGNFGVGSIYDFMGESLVLTDTMFWLDPRYRGKGDEIFASRLIESLKSSGFPRLTALYQPVKEGSFVSNAGALPYMRFPRWLFCSTCRRMRKWTFANELDGETPRCSCQKQTKLTPMRFIVICENGHMSDLDWPRWAHSKPTNPEQKTCKSEKINFESGHTKSGGLESVGVKCQDCGAFRTLEGITAPNILKTIGTNCTGKQPWQRGIDAVECNEVIHVVQRGAGNVYFPSVVSAITIPPESDFKLPESDKLSIRIKDNYLYSYVAKAYVSNNDVFFEMMVSELCKAVGCVRQDVLDCLTESEESASEMPIVDIESEEWDALVSENVESDDRDKFVTKHVKLSSENFPEELKILLRNVVSVVKLREVRVFTGFNRYQPKGENGNIATVRPDLGSNLDWLPATEFYGEGIFISFNESEVCKWESDHLVASRSSVLEIRKKNSTYKFLPQVNSRFIMLHTLAHMLIRRLAFECGYSSASLRERIYCKPGARAGILIYTAAGDVEGTLGGLSRQAEDDRFSAMFLNALQDGLNCSADPICMESTGQGIEALSLAACHACTLVSETSCAYFNTLLDRSLVVGDGHVHGFFENVIAAEIERTIAQK